MDSTSIDYKKRICRAMNYISRNIEQNPSLEEIARSASFSMFHFHRIFKAVVGETVAGFKRRLRLELAANRLLSRPLDDITTIAIDCGFSSSQNFAKAFRGHFGQSPSQFRDSKIGNTDSKNENALKLQAVYDPDTVFVNQMKRERRQTMKTQVKEMPELTVAYVRKLGPYAEETCRPAFDELMQWAAPRNLVGPEKVLGIYWDNPDVTPAEKCRFDACIKIPENTPTQGQIQTQKLLGGPYAICSFEIDPGDIAKAWDNTFGWVCDSGYDCKDEPCYELYHNNAAEHPDGKWIVDLYVPLKEKI